jgi:NAD(P)H-dependent FMN reductase
MNIAIISASVRIGRRSHRVALFFKNYIEQNHLATVDLLDLYQFQFPIFDERLRFMKNPSADVLDFADRIKKADGVLIVTPEYNGGYPAALKNVIDLLYAEWQKKPLALATVSAGPFGGAQVNTSLVFSLWKIGVLLVPAMFLTPKVQDAFQENGTPNDKEGVENRAKPFIDELLWCMEAKRRMSAQTLSTIAPSSEAALAKSNASAS